MNELTQASVIIPSYNSIKTIPFTLARLLQQTALPQLLEIIVVDSSDDLETKAFLDSQTNDRIKVMTSGSRVMPAIQRNIGARAARGALFVFIDSDAYPADNWLEIILQAYQKGWKAGGGSYMLPPEQLNNPVTVAQYFLEFSEFIPFGKERRKDLLPSCNLYCDAELFRQVKGFPNIRASEDSLFGRKVSRITPMTFLPDARVYHIFRQNKKHYLDNQLLLGKYIYVYHRLHSGAFYYEKPYLFLLLPVFLAFKSARIFIRTCLLGDLRLFLRFLTSIHFFVKGLSKWTKGFIEGSSEYDKIVALMDSHPG